MLKSLTRSRTTAASLRKKKPIKHEKVMYRFFGAGIGCRHWVLRKTLKVCLALCKTKKMKEGKRRHIKTVTKRRKTKKAHSKSKRQKEEKVEA
jgi:hypothetical protein